MWVISTCVSTFRSHTVLSNVFQAHFHRGAIDTNMESLKEYFSTLVILYIQTEATEEYKDFSSSVGTTRLIYCWISLQKNRSGVKKDVYIHGKQDCLDDVMFLLILSFS